MATARKLRRQLYLIRPDNTTYRLIHGAGDGLPGLIIDIYGKVAVVQCHSIGMFRERQQIASALCKVFGEELEMIYNRSGRTLSSNFQTEEKMEGILWGSAPADQMVIENGHQFQVNVETGQKTGFFLDQRDNRSLLACYAEGQQVLNTFCYTGGFSVYALKAGAKQVTSVDISAKAMALTEANVALNGNNLAARHLSITADVMQYFKEESNEHYDIVVVDPPAFAKNRGARHRAVQAYKRLNIMALRRLRPGGLLFTFSCSQVVDRELFHHTIVAAGLESGRSASVLHHLSQGGDHPTNLFHPEGSYLKGLVLRVI
ncbi:MAG: class I SAM-dependent rRNA methyltransferase [Bacteroidota bacterium]